MSKRFVRILSMVLVLVLLSNLLPMQILAEELTAGDHAQIVTPGGSTAATDADIHVVDEVTENRTEYSKEFLLSDGTRLAAVYTDPVH